MISRFVFSFAAVAFMAAPCLAAEGSSAAGVVGGSDIRAALLPPPGFYAVGIAAGSDSQDFYDSHGNKIAALDDLELGGGLAGLALIYVPDFKLLDGHFSLLGSLYRSVEHGRFFASTTRRSEEGWGDLYLELNWSRLFGKMRPSTYSGAFPIPEGLAVQFGVGVIFPTGQYDRVEAASHGLSIGNNIWDVAPMAAVTYTTPPILAEGTEFSAKAYWNNYQTNDQTKYRTGDIPTLEVAVSERIGRFQVGFAGIYGKQIEDDRVSGVSVPPDGRRLNWASAGAVVAIDFPELGSSLKIKALKTVIERNSIDSKAIVVTYGMKLY